MEERHALEILERIKNRHFKPEIPEEQVEKYIEKCVQEQRKSDVIKHSEELYDVFKNIYTEGGGEG